MYSLLDLLAKLHWWVWIFIFLALVAIWDIFIQRRHTIKHNFPIVGHLRYWLESIGPEMRQYFVANNREELPFNRIERGWIYASAKSENNYEGFGCIQQARETLSARFGNQCFCDEFWFVVSRCSGGYEQGR